MNKVIIIRGPLGVGKSTVAREVAKKIRGEHVSVDDVLTQNNLDVGDKTLGCIPEANFLKANEIMSPHIKEVVEGGGSVVIDGNFYHKAQVDDLIGRYPGEVKVFTLHAPISVCVRRDAERPMSYGEGAAKAVFNLVSRFDYGETIDASRLTISEMVDIITSK